MENKIKLFFGIFLLMILIGGLVSAEEAPKDNPTTWKPSDVKTWPAYKDISANNKQAFHDMLLKNSNAGAEWKETRKYLNDPTKMSPKDVNALYTELKNKEGTGSGKYDYTVGEYFTKLVGIRGADGKFGAEGVNAANRMWNSIDEKQKAELIKSLREYREKDKPNETPGYDALFNGALNKDSKINDAIRLAMLEEFRGMKKKDGSALFTEANLPKPIISGYDKLESPYDKDRGLLGKKDSTGKVIGGITIKDPPTWLREAKYDAAISGKFTEKYDSQLTGKPNEYRTIEHEKGFVNGKAQYVSSSGIEGADILYGEGGTTTITEDVVKGVSYAMTGENNALSFEKGGKDDNIISSKKEGTTTVRILDGIDTSSPPKEVRQVFVTGAYNYWTGVIRPVKENDPNDFGKFYYFGREEVGLPIEIIVSDDKNKWIEIPSNAPPGARFDPNLKPFIFVGGKDSEPRHVQVVGNNIQIRPVGQELTISELRTQGTGIRVVNADGSVITKINGEKVNQALVDGLASLTSASDNSPVRVYQGGGYEIADASKIGPGLSDFVSRATAEIKARADAAASQGEGGDCSTGQCGRPPTGTSNPSVQTVIPSGIPASSGTPAQRPGYTNPPTATGAIQPRVKYCPTGTCLYR